VHEARQRPLDLEQRQQRAPLCLAVLLEWQPAVQCHVRWRAREDLVQLAGVLASVLEFRRQVSLALDGPELAFEIKEVDRMVADLQVRQPIVRQRLVQL
jgi:hypothetical protein